MTKTALYENNNFNFINYWVTVLYYVVLCFWEAKLISVVQLISVVKLISVVQLFPIYVIFIKFWSILRTTLAFQTSCTVHSWSSVNINNILSQFCTDFFNWKIISDLKVYFLEERQNQTVLPVHEPQPACLVVTVPLISALLEAQCYTEVVQLMLDQSLIVDWGRL